MCSRLRKVQFFSIFVAWIGLCAAIGYRGGTISSPVELNNLPWLDDFADFQSGLSPDFWDESGGVYLNNHLAIGPPSIGVVSFDGIDVNGVPYSVSQDKYDVLTSKVIDLSPYSGEVVSLAFQVQYVGRSFAPRSSSVRSQFVCEGKNSSGAWERITIYRDYEPDQEFRSFGQILPQQFLHDQFQLRFWNKAVRPAGDQTPVDLNPGYEHMWHLDYVTIDLGEPLEYAIDVAFQEKAIVGLKRYVSMPFSQYYVRPKEMLSDSIQFSVENHFPYTQKTQEGMLRLWNKDRGALWTSALFRRFPQVIEDQNILVEGKHTFVNPVPLDSLVTILTSYDPYGNYDFQFQLSYRQDEEEVFGWDQLMHNNMVYTDLTFGDYYAYDDGTAEAEGNLIADDRNTVDPTVAIEFETFLQDDLIGFEFFIPSSQSFDLSGREADLVVWLDTLDDSPELRIPDFSFEPTPKFPSNYQRVLFRDLGLGDITVPAGKFYIGAQIRNKPNNYQVLIGWDDSRPEATQYIYYRERADRGWEQSKGRFRGYMPMLRPVMANETDITTSITNQQVLDSEKFQIFPNPASDFVHIIQSNRTEKELFLTIFDLTGRKIDSQDLTGYKVDVTDLKSGIYLFVLKDESRKHILGVHKISIFK